MTFAPIITMSYLGNDRYNGGDRDRDRSRGSRDRATLESDYGRLNDAEWGYGRGRGRSPGEWPPLSAITAVCAAFWARVLAAVCLCFSPE